MRPPPAISLIVSTRDRVGHVARLLASLVDQAGPSFDVVVVDQNVDDRLLPELAGPWPFPLRHIRRPHDRGVSRGRNVGWRASGGAFLLFPDDNAWYPPGFLARAGALAARHRADIVTGRSTDEQGETINGRYAARAGPISRSGVWTRQIEWITLVRRETLNRIGGYDEDLGVGAHTPWQAAEGPDLLIRAIDAGAIAWYDPALIAFHDTLPARAPDEALIAKARGYGRGMGRVLRLRGCGVAFMFYWLARSCAALGQATLCRDRRRMRYCRSVLLGRIEGMLGRPDPMTARSWSAEHSVRRADR